jgi:hypothetical protein
MIMMTVQSFAQPQRFERIHALKVGYLTDKLHLSSTQAERFWPVYNKYEKELWDIRRSYRQQMKGDIANNPEAAREFIDNDLGYQEAVLNLRKKYNNEFLSVLSTQQLADLLQAERDFKKMLIQQLRDKRGGRGPQ